jgi:hypothetical protein
MLFVTSSLSAASNEGANPCNHLTTSVERGVGGTMDFGFVSPSLLGKAATARGTTTRFRWGTWSWILAASMSITLLSTSAHAELSDRGDAEKVIQELSTAKDTPTASQSLIQAAKTALNRATRMLDSGDRKHSSLAESLAKTFAESARDLIRAIAIEKELHDTQRQLTEITGKVKRAQVLLDESISRRGRAKVELQRAEEEAAQRKPSAKEIKKANKTSKPKRKGNKRRRGQ